MKTHRLIALLAAIFFVVSLAACNRSIPGSKQAAATPAEGGAAALPTAGATDVLEQIYLFATQTAMATQGLSGTPRACASHSRSPTRRRCRDAGRCPAACCAGAPSCSACRSDCCPSRDTRPPFILYPAKERVPLLHRPQVRCRSRRAVEDERSHQLFGLLWRYGLENSPVGSRLSWQPLFETPPRHLHRPPRRHPLFDCLHLR